jgi:glycine cleavage system transcriptional repressor
MTDQWFMLTLIGEDKPGIVAAVTKTLYEMGLNLGETSMLRLGGNFTIMMMVSGASDESLLCDQLEPVIAAQGMRLHVDPIQAHLHDHLLPNIQVTVSGADRAGILDLESDVAGTRDRPVYIMQIAGVADVSVEAIERALRGLREGGVDVNVSAVETYIG